MQTRFTFDVAVGYKAQQHFKKIITITSIKPIEQDLYNALDQVHDELMKSYPAGTPVNVSVMRTEYIFQLKN